MHYSFASANIFTKYVRYIRLNEKLKYIRSDDSGSNILFSSNNNNNYEAVLNKSRLSQPITLPSATSCF